MPVIVDLPQITWRPLPIQQPAIVPSMLVLHTAVSNAASLYNWFNGPSHGVESHVYIRADGTGEQYVSADMRADANGNANRWLDPDRTTWRGAFSVETWDNKDPSIPWTDPQIATIADLARWLNRTYAMPLTLATPTNWAGIAWHSLVPTWSPGHHTCPGPVRIAQIHDQLMPMLTQPSEEDDMPGLAQLGTVMAAVTEIYLTHRGQPPSPTERAAWARDLETKLRAGTDPVPTLEYLAWALDQEKAPKAAKG